MKISVKKKILFTDLDGTLLTDEKKIGSRTFRFLDAFTGAGNYLVLSSGRDINSIKNVKETLGFHFPNLFLTGYNGGQIFDCTRQETIYKVSLKKEQAVFIIGTALNMGIHCHTYSETHIISPRSLKELSYYKRAITTPVIFADDIAVLSAALASDPGKCIAIHLEDQRQLEKLRDKILGAYDDVAAIFSSPVYLEFFPACSGKGVALIKLCEILGFDIADAIAAGDQENDLSMLKAAGYGIAMCNGAGLLKENADAVTAFDNNQDGLAAALEDLIC